MHASKPESPRLRRVLALLNDGRKHSTKNIIDSANVMAVNSCVAELRARGYVIACERRSEGGRPRWYYQLRRQGDLFDQGQP